MIHGIEGMLDIWTSVIRIILEDPDKCKMIPNLFKIH